jgi:hypothetical protein
MPAAWGQDIIEYLRLAESQIIKHRAGDQAACTVHHCDQARSERRYRRRICISGPHEVTRLRNRR